MEVLGVDVVDGGVFGKMNGINFPLLSFSFSPLFSFCGPFGGSSQIGSMCMAETFFTIGDSADSESKEMLAAAVSER